MQNTLLKITKSVLNCPTAPFRETAVRDYILDFCRRRGIRTTTDAMGNILAIYGKRSKNRPIVFVAHTDHPGFIIEKDSVQGKTTALFYGGVEKEYFKKNTAIRVYTSQSAVKGKIEKVYFNRKKQEKRIFIAVEKPVNKGDLAMWDLPAYRMQSDKIAGRACDDIIGCASILTLFDKLYRRKIQRNVMALFSVAEEAGLHGAKYAAMKRLIPRNAVVISIETSSALPAAPVGKGVVIRVGDRRSIFHPEIIKWMIETAVKIQKKDKMFQFQRKLMDGGTCEASIFSAFGCTVGAVCIPLGNYHNRDSRRKKIAAEFVSFKDLLNMVKLFINLVQTGPSGVKLSSPIPRYKKHLGKLGESFWD